MNTTNTLHLSPVQMIGKIFGWLLRFILLEILYIVLFAVSGQIVGPYLPIITAEPGPLPLMNALLLVSTTSTAVIMLTIYTSRWHGWKLMLTMSVAYYLVLTLVTQLEAWYFLYGITVGPELMIRLFLQGIPVAFIFVPIAILVMGRFCASANESPSPEIGSMPLKEWLWRLGVIYLVYLVVYYLAGYFIAWQNPEVRAFYGSPGEALPFFQQMGNIFLNDPWLTPYQLLRTLIWVAGAYVVIRGSRFSLWQTALIVGLMLSVPQNIGHLIPNAMIPLNSVRISHMIETASSTFVFGVIAAWLLYPRYVVREI